MVILLVVVVDVFLSSGASEIYPFFISAQTLLLLLSLELVDKEEEIAAAAVAMQLSSMLPALL
jgi:hypothetical protein